MNIFIILNGIAPKKNQFYKSILPILQPLGEVHVHETQYHNHAIQLAQEAINKADIIIAAGGDGTLNQILNGLLLSSHNSNLPTLGIIPLGTGNDFANACRITLNGEHLAKLIQQRSFILTDVGKIQLHTDQGDRIEKYFLNACSAGMGPNIALHMQHARKKKHIFRAYWISTMRTFFLKKPQFIRLQSNSWSWEGLSRIVAVVNGKTIAGTICIDPNSQVDNNRQTAFIVGPLSKPAFLHQLAILQLGYRSKHRQIIYHQAQEYTMSGKDPLIVEADGEIQGHLPATIKVMAKTIHFLRPE